MVIARAGAVTRLHAAARKDGRDVVVEEGPFIPGHNEDRPRRRERLGLQDQRHLARQPLVARRDGAVVHVIEKVGRDEREVRSGGRRHQIRRQLCERHDVGTSSLDVAGDVFVVQERVVPYGVFA